MKVVYDCRTEIFLAVIVSYGCQLSNRFDRCKNYFRAIVLGQIGAHDTIECQNPRISADPKIHSSAYSFIGVLEARMLIPALKWQTLSRFSTSNDINLSHENVFRADRKPRFLAPDRRKKYLCMISIDAFHDTVSQIISMHTAYLIRKT